MRRAQGFEKVKQFQHKAKIRRTGGSDQSLKLSGWDQLMSVKRSVDTARVSWPGIVYLQKACGMFDPKPRLVRHRGY